MDAGQVLRVRIEQLGIDVAITVEAADGGDRLELDSPVQGRGPDGGTYVATGAGIRRVEVCAGGSAGAGGHYRIHRDPLRFATETDRTEDAAYRAYAEGRGLRRPEARPQARAAFERALAGFRRAGTVRPQGWTLYKLAQIAQADGDLAVAEERYRSAAAVHRSLADHHQEAVALGWLGTLLLDGGRSRLARDVYEEESRAALDAGAHDLAGVSLVGRARASYRLGDTAEALALYERAITELVEGGSSSELNDAYHGLGLFYRSAGRPERAIRTYTQALRAAREAHDRQAEAAVFLWLAGAHLDLGQARPALRYLEEAMPRLTSESAPEHWLEAQDELGRAYRQLGRYEEAGAAYERALRSHPDDLWEATLRINLARLRAERGDPAGAIEECRGVLPLTVSLGRTGLIASVEACIAFNLAALGRAEEALGEIRDAVAQVESVRRGFAPDELQASFFAGRHQYFELYVEVLLDLDREAPGEGHLEEAFEVAERSKARTLLDVLERVEPRVERSAPAELVDRKELLERQISSLEVELLREGGAAGRAAASRLERLELDLAAVRASILASHPGWRSALATEPADLQTLRRELLADGETQIVSFFLGDEGSVVWVVGRDRLVVRELPPRREIEALSTATADLLAQSHQPHRRLQSELYVDELSRMILQPIADALDGRRLLLLKEGALHAVPFGVLTLARGESGPRFLADRFELVEAPSASTALALGHARSGRPRPSKLLAILADPVFRRDDPRIPQTEEDGREVGRPTQATSSSVELATDLRNLPRLPASASEAEAIAHLARSADPLVALGFAATRDLVLGGRLRDFRMIHIATHGVASQPVSGLVFSLWDAHRHSVEGFVSDWEIYDLELSADLVVLSACRSGLGERLAGEGVLGLARAFLWAGAARVLVSLWDVDDQATARLMSEFYREMLDRDATPGEALRRAQRSIRSRPEWSAPHYWAGFVLQGDSS